MTAPVTQADMAAAAAANDYSSWDAFWHGAGSSFAQSQARAFARHRHATEAAAKAREDALVEALEIAWREAHQMRNASKLVGPYPNDPKANRLWARSLYHAGKDLCAKLKPYRTALAAHRAGGEG